MAELAHYIELVTYNPLEKAEMRGWMKTLTDILPKGLISSVSSIRGVDPIRLIHRTGNGKHKYIVPLIRNLSDEEFATIVKHVISPDGEHYEINTSDVGAKSHRQLPSSVELVDQEILDKLAEDIARIQHNNWKDHRANNGWQYGVIHNGLEKQSPMIKDWKELPETAKYVDKRLPKEIFHLIESYGFSIIANDTLDAILDKYDNRKTFTNKE